VRIFLLVWDDDRLRTFVLSEVSTACYMFMLWLQSAWHMVVETRV